MKSVREVCKCGHDKATHFEKRHTCLGVHCDCPFYRNEDEPDAPSTLRGLPVAKPSRKPHADWHCPCTACQDWMYEEQRKLFDDPYP